MASVRDAVPNLKYEFWSNHFYQSYHLIQFPKFYQN